MARARLLPPKSGRDLPATPVALRCPLLYAASETNADQLYFGKFFAPDAYLAFGRKKQRVAVLNALEYGRALRESSYDTVLRLEEWQKKAKEEFGVPAPGLAHIVKLLAGEYSIGSFVVPADFPAGLLENLRALKVRVEVSEGPMFPERILKTKEQAADIREACRAAAAGLGAAERVLRRATVRRSGELFLEDRPLTSEYVRFLVDVAVLETGGKSEGTIVAGGEQACDPHCRGSGPLRAGELIIVDVFPRMPTTGFHGDMTRTFLKGRASEAQRDLVAAVRRAQKVACKKIAPGVTGRRVHRAVQKFFDKAGFETRRKPTHHEGFFHGTGHGLGLEVHEPPRLNLTGPRLQEGMVVTVEPGLYYPGLGGCRIEDVVQVTAEGCKLLSDYDYNWHLR